MNHATFGTCRKTFLVALAVFLLSGCQSYREDQSRTVGEFTDDVGIQSNVKTRLLRDDEIKGWRINVNVRKGVVTLYGRVPNEALRRRVVSLAEGVKGVVRVEDGLTIVTE